MKLDSVGGPYPKLLSHLHHTSHDNLLFNAIVLVGWHCLLRLGKLINRIRTIFPSNDIAGHSLRSGGTTALALTGTPLHKIQSAGCWSSDAFLIYLRKNPLLIQGLLTGCSAFDAQQTDH